MSDFSYYMKRDIRIFYTIAYPVILPLIVGKFIHFSCISGLLLFPYFLTILWILFIEGCFRKKHKEKDDPSHALLWMVLPISFICGMPLVIDYLNNPDFVVTSPIFVIVPLSLYFLLYIQDTFTPYLQVRFKAGSGGDGELTLNGMFVVAGFAIAIVFGLVRIVESLI